MAKHALLIAVGCALIAASASAQIIPTPSPASAYGSTVVASAAVESCHVIKAAAGNLYGLTVTTTGSATANDWVLIYNATSAPADGTTAPVAWGRVGPNAQFAWSAQTVPAYFSTGIVACLSTTGPVTKTAEAQAVFSGLVR